MTPERQPSKTLAAERLSREAAASAEQIEPHQQLADKIAEQVSRWGRAALDHGGGPVRADAVATLALLRRATLSDLGRYPQMWAAVVNLVPPILRGRGDDPSRAEAATFAALAMFAVHQQSQGELVHRTGRSLGEALGRLAQISTHSSAGMTRRFGALMTSESTEEMLHHLRSLISLLRNAKRPDGSSLDTRVDYGALARDLDQLMSPERAPGVRLRWGRDFARTRPESSTKQSDTITKE